MYNLLIIMSLMLAFFINYGVSLWPTTSGNDQWRVAMGIQLIPGVLMCLMIPFVPETSRYLINHGKLEQGLNNLAKLRNLPSDHPYVQLEYREMKAQVEYEQECHQGHSYWVVIKDIFLIKSNFRRFFLAVMLFLFHKFTGTDSLNVCPPGFNAQVKQ
jgi:MFS family permease